MKKLALFIIVGWFALRVASASPNTSEIELSKSGSEKAIRIGQHVLVTIKDGTTVETIVRGCKGKKIV